MSPLSNRQKFILANLAREAWQKTAVGRMSPSAEAPAPAGGQLAASKLPSEDGPTEEEYRHAQVLAATGRSGLRSCTQEHYQPLRAHFLQILGRDDQALNAHLRDTSNGRRIVRFKLNLACQRAGVTLNYAISICRSKFKTTLEDATEKQLWSIKYDIDRAAKRRREARAQFPVTQ